MGQNNFFGGKNGAIAWEGLEMREKWGNCVTLTLNALQLAGLVYDGIWKFSSGLSAKQNFFTTTKSIASLLMC